MLKFNVYPYFHLRAVGNPRRFLLGLGINHLTVAKLLKGETTSLRLEHVEKVCRALRCTPNDLLEWTPDANIPLDAAHPLHRIAPRKNIDKLLDKLGSMSYEEMGEWVEKL